MNRVLLIFSFLISLNVFALSDCDKNLNNFPNLKWEKLTELTVITIIQDLEARLCLGRDGDKIELITYEDSSGNKETFPIKK